MSLLSEYLSPSRKTRTHRKETLSISRHVSGLDGPVELRRVAGGYLQVWPRPSPEFVRALYRDDFYEDDKASYLSDKERDLAYWNATWSMRRKLMESALAPSRRKFLDVGSGGGFLLDHFQKNGWQGVGIEPSNRAAAWARKKFDLEIFSGELLDYTLEPSEGSTATPHSSTRKFDAIHSSQVIEHVLDPEACIARIAELLAADGVAYIEVPNEFNTFQETARERLGTHAWWVAPRHHLNYFNFETLAGLLERHGLVEIDRLSSFPIEMFLLMGDDYVGHPEVGTRCHARRMSFEQSLIETDRVDELLRLYRAFAQAGVGRTCGILARKR